MEDRHVGIDLSTYDSTITNDLSNDSEDTNRTNLSPRPPPPRRMPPRGLTRSKLSFRPPSNTRTSNLCSKMKYAFALFKLNCNNCSKSKVKRDDIHQVYSPDKDTNLLSWFEGGVHNFSDWVYRAPFIALLTVCTLVYFAFVIFYAVILMLVNKYYFDRYGNGCISGLNFGNENLSDRFEYTFDLSWSTFSTVGYGLFSPGASSRCWGIRILCAIEAFTGILFASCCGAFLYSKIGRIQYSAPVTFSKIMCLQYGEGLLDSDVKSTVGTYLSTRNLQAVGSRRFPFIEFRIVHNDCNKYRRAIVDAALSCYIILPTETSSLLDKGYTVPNFRHTASYLEEEPVGYKEKMHFPGKVFHQLKIDNEKLPFFDKVWYVRHILDETSPLLKDHVKVHIKKNGGDTWPDELDSYESIHDSIIDFQLITVQLQGMSQVTASPVYAEMEYNIKDIYIGWQFTGLLYHTKDIYGKHKIVVDNSIMHDITPQRGGRHQPIHDDV